MSEVKGSTYFYKLPLEKDTDVDILEWINKIPRNKKAEVIRHAIRFYMSHLKEGQLFYYPSPTSEGCKQQLLEESEEYIMLSENSRHFNGVGAKSRLPKVQINSEDACLDIVDILNNKAYTFGYNSYLKGICVYDNHRREVRIEEAKSVCQAILNYYNSLSKEEEIELKKRQIEEKLYEMTSLYGSPYYFKEFRQNLKRHWSFKCEQCQKKVSSKADIGYWITDICSLPVPFGRYCSETCAEKVFKPIVNKAREGMYKDYGLFYDGEEPIKT
ncbi:hypothetical protein CN627_07940 [Bacillus wiedmannii]|uniref:hypothetical protein n=1 Tax=Bacillus wiedmannii TaxID=1890302 RepID=UPI000BF0C4FF|nr:hypothetical protein [Bacillus wiedmannii]PEM89629.1 hypothetical protein CN627_07940 [Bacillus wiedmannii]